MLMINTFVVALAPFKSHWYFFIYLPCKNIGQVGPSGLI